jgi:hypothetical protein
MSVGSEARPVFKLNEDWLATVIGLILALIIGLGLLGAGQQSVAVNAAPGKNAARPANAVGGWAVSATIGDKKVTIADAPKQLERGKTYVITCKDGALTAVLAADTLPEGITPAPADRAQIAIANTCDAEVRLTYSVGAVVPYPLFRLF